MALRVCLVEWILGRMEKNEGEKSFGGCLVGEGRGKTKVGPRCFLPRPTKKFSSQNEEKLLESLIY